MELKPGMARSAALVESRFNRTFMELKLSPYHRTIMPGSALIGPLWN